MLACVLISSVRQARGLISMQENTPTGTDHQCCSGSRRLSGSSQPLSPCFLTHIVEGSGNWTQRYPNYLLVSALTRYRRLSLKLCRPSPGAGVQGTAVCRGQAVGRGPPPSKLYRGVSIALCSVVIYDPDNRSRQSLFQRLRVPVPVHFTLNQ